MGAKDAENLHRGMDFSTENSVTSSTELTGMTPREIVSGVAEDAIAHGIQVHNLRRSAAREKFKPLQSLSADEAQRLARIRKDRANKFMISAPDVDFLLELIGR